MTYDNKIGKQEQDQRTYDNTAEARRSNLVDTSGSSFTSSNPFPVVGTLTVAPSSTNIEYQSVATVPSNVLTTVLTFTNPGASFYLNHIDATGTAEAEWFIYHEGVLQFVKRTTSSEMNLDTPMYKFIVAGSEKIEVKVKHYQTATQDFDCSLKYER